MRFTLANLAIAAACTRTPGPVAPDAPATPPPPTTSPILVVATKADANVSVIELPGGRVLATLPTGVGPHEVAISPDGRRAVVTNYGDQTTLGRSLTVIDLAALKVTGTIELGEYRRPHGAAFLPDGHRVIVTAEVNAGVVIVDLETAKVERGIFTSQQGSHMLTLAPDGTKAYVANMASGTVSTIDLVTMSGADPVPAIAACEGIAITPDGKQVWTASLQQDQIVVLDTPALTQAAQIPAMGAPIRLVPTPDGKSMLVANAKASALQVIDTATRTPSNITFPAINGESAVPVGTTVSTDGTTAYVALVAEDRVAIVDLPSKTITGHLTVGRGPDGIGYSSAFVAR